MSGPEHYCKLHDWQTIGRISTNNGMFALVAPYAAAHLDRWWQHKLDLGPLFRAWWEEHRNFAQADLDDDAALLVSCDNGPYDVQARFCDLYGDGHLSICALRVDFHAIEHDDEDEDE
jgi:hypothetical protein